MMNTRILRKKFLDYFKKNEHVHLPSSPVVPHEDPTLLFINAGMNQFKDVFLGESIRDYSRATTSQKCIRVGGKHNDLENVGHTKRHLTFFEMLGNFSFGDYFKEEAIRFAWEVSTEVFEFDPNRIWPTVFETDDEAFELWLKYVPEKRITRFGEKENFWAMGDTGPCGPCSELLFDRGEKFGNAPNPKSDLKEERYLEFWNLVFMQFNRSEDGVMAPLPKPSIDTGAGLERVVDLKMDTDTVFETDILRTLIANVEKISGKKYDPIDHRLAPSFRVIADHLRALSFAIADGAQPSNLDRGYVLRKVLRRAVRYGRLLELNDPFLGKLVPTLVDQMGEEYPELKQSQERIQELLTLEEEAFGRTLRKGGNLLEKVIFQAKHTDQCISGDEAFKLKDTYGLPLDEILLLAKDENLRVDTKRFETLEEEAKVRSRQGQKKTTQLHQENLFSHFRKDHPPVEFVGYHKHSTEGSVTALLKEGKFVNRLTEGEEGILILNKTPFYAEKGGQVGDLGEIASKTGKARVTDCQNPFDGVIAHHVHCLFGEFAIGDRVTATIDHQRRQKIANNHTATHLLHWALCQVLGEHIRQAGSVVDEKRLRFDFSHHKALTETQIQAVEDLVNEKIRLNLPVNWYEIPFDEAQKTPEIKQFFGDKYGAQVRVVDIDFSKELCGGTHTESVGNIGLFTILKEGSIAAGVRRIEATTGQEAINFYRESIEALQGKIQTASDEARLLQQKIKQMEKEKLAHSIDALAKQAKEREGCFQLITQIDVSSKDLKNLTQELGKKFPSYCIVLGTQEMGRAYLVAQISLDLTKKGYSAAALIEEIAPLIGGSGGGKPNFAQAGGSDPNKLKEALHRARELLHCD